MIHVWFPEYPDNFEFIEIDGTNAAVLPKTWAAGS